MSQATQQRLIGTTHQCEKCGYEILLGPGHHMDLAVCVVCGTGLVIQYEGMFASCSEKTPGTLYWITSEELQFDDRDDQVLIREGVLPIPETHVPDIQDDRCPKCQASHSLTLHLPDECECPWCHKGIMRKIGTWIP